MLSLQSSAWSLSEYGAQTIEPCLRQLPPPTQAHDLCPLSKTSSHWFWCCHFTSICPTICLFWSGYCICKYSHNSKHLVTVAYLITVRLVQWLYWLGSHVHRAGKLSVSPHLPPASYLEHLQQKRKSNPSQEGCCQNSNFALRWVRVILLGRGSVGRSPATRCSPVDPPARVNWSLLLFFRGIFDRILSGLICLGRPYQGQPWRNQTCISLKTPSISYRDCGVKPPKSPSVFNNPFSFHSAAHFTGSSLLQLQMKK